MGFVKDLVQINRMEQWLTCKSLKDCLNLVSVFSFTCSACIHIRSLILSSVLPNHACRCVGFSKFCMFSCISSKVFLPYAQCSQNRLQVCPSKSTKVLPKIKQVLKINDRRAGRDSISTIYDLPQGELRKEEWS